MNQQKPSLFPIGRAAAAIALLALLGACSEDSMPEGPPDLPASETLPMLNWARVAAPITPYIIRNRGGTLSSCYTLVARPLPAGLQVSVTENRRDCQITGNPTLLPGDIQNKQLTIYAGNRHGVDSVVVTLFGG